MHWKPARPVEVRPKAEGPLWEAEINTLRERGPDEKSGLET